MKFYFTFFISFFTTIAILELATFSISLIILLLFLILLCLTKPKYLKWSISAVVIAVVSHAITTPNINNQSHISFYNESKKTITGTIIDIDERRDHTLITLSNLEIEQTSINGNILIKTHRYPRQNYGSTLEATGKLQSPQPYEDFNYPKYLALRNIYSKMIHPKIRKLPERKVSKLLKSITTLRTNIEDRFNQLLTEPHASFIAGLLIGSRRGLPADIIQDFQTTGLTHIIAISGYNITLLIIFISKALYFLSRKWQVIASSLLIIFFTLLVGSSAAVIRAALMGIIGLIAIISQRKSQITLSLLWSGFFMVLINPLTLIYDIGFQLSFMAVLSLIYILPEIERISNRIPESNIKEGFLTTIAAQVLVLPIILINFQNISLISPIANVLVAPFLPLAMLFGFFLLITSIVLWPFTIIFKTATWLILEIIIQLTKICANVPYAGIKISWFNNWHAIAYYAAIILWLNKSNLIIINRRHPN